MTREIYYTWFQTLFNLNKNAKLRLKSLKNEYRKLIFYSPFTFKSKIKFMKIILI